MFSLIDLMTQHFFHQVRCNSNIKVELDLTNYVAKKEAKEAISSDKTKLVKAV